MPRYIDAYKLWDAIDSIDTVQGLNNAVFIYDVIQAIDNAPTADVQEVKHGRWELKTKTNAHCSNCDFIRSIETQIGWKYCPKCGAKMEDEE